MVLFRSPCNELIAWRAIEPGLSLFLFPSEFASEPER